jgi:hypothetical protein
VAREGLRVSGSMLEVVLPLEKNDYMKDFETGESRKEFEELLNIINQPIFVLIFQHL